MTKQHGRKAKPGHDAIAGEIRSRREAIGLTPLEFAERIGVDRSAVSHWERGISAPRGARMAEVARVLGCSIGELYGERAS